MRFSFDLLVLKLVLFESSNIEDVHSLTVQPRPGILLFDDESCGLQMIEIAGRDQVPHIWMVQREILKRDQSGRL